MENKKMGEPLKKRVQDFQINFKKKSEEYKGQPNSKRKSFFMGVGIVLGIFGVTLFGPAVSAVAKDIPKGNLKPTDIAPAPSVAPSPELSAAAAAAACADVLLKGSFALGVALGCLLVAGVLYMQGK